MIRTASRRIGGREPDALDAAPQARRIATTAAPHAGGGRGLAGRFGHALAPALACRAQTLAYQALTRLGRTWDNETDPLRSFLRPEALRLIDELDNDELDHSRRAKIGERLATIGDPRSGIGVHDGTPDIVWHDIAEDRQAMARLAVAPFRIARYPVTWRQFQAPRCGRRLR